MDKVRLREALADLAHRQQSEWMRVLFLAFPITEKDGSVVIPKWAVDRFKQKMAMPYVALPYLEKNRPRQEADKFIQAFEAVMSFHDLKVNGLDEESNDNVCTSPGYLLNCCQSIP